MVRVIRAIRMRASSESGSIAPLAIGLASVLLASVLTFVDAGSLMLFQQREFQLAESMALAVDQALTPIQLASSVTQNTYLLEVADRFGSEAGIHDFTATTPDGKTVLVSVCAQFDPPVKIPLVGLPANRTVCAKARARRI
jgi:Tfp pilus assembly protein PilZ